MISIAEAYNIVKRVHQDMGWVPNGASSREQRNAWWEAAVAAVHYGHPLFNPVGGDRDLCIKSAGGGRPQSDDIIVRASTREYWDFIVSTGSNGYYWNLTSHSDRLSAEQVVYPPSRDALELLPGPVAPPVVEPGEPQPEPEPPTGDLARDIADLKAMVASLVESQTLILNGLGAAAVAVGDSATRQEALFDQQTKRLFGLLVEEDGSTQPGIPEVTASLIRR